MVWINDEILAVGTTRGNVVVFSIGNEHVGQGYSSASSSHSNLPAT